MKKLSDIITEHARKYPLMKPQDAALLVYENEYGPGKYKESDEALSNRFKLIYDEAIKRRNTGTESLEAREDIGGGYIRVYLSHVDLSSYEQVKQAYIDSVKESNGGHYFLTPKLYELIDVKLQGEFGFSMQEFEEYLLEYEALDYPKPAHSSEYAAAYDDKYCVISDKYLENINFI